jgi:predicted ATPase
MITELKIAGFKRFSSCSLDLAPLTVLAGLNGAGKTSVIQALLLLREASLSSARTVPLNGPLGLFGLELGSAQDVLNINAALDTSEIFLSVRMADDTPYSVVLDARDEALLHLPIKARTTPVPAVLGGAHRSFTYLCAERLGPRSVLGASAQPADDLGVGIRGELCAQVLAVHGMRQKVARNRLHPEPRADSEVPREAYDFLKYQVEAWLSDIVRPIEIDTVWYPNTTVTALRFRDPGGDWVRAPNMGFGVSYSLPIILAGLFAPEEGGLLLVENPEAHLHPAGQSRMGTFLATLAGAGVQVLVETQSDHVLNGIRRAIAELRVLPADRALVHFFDVGTGGEPQISALRFTPAGGMSDWPRRFFDQYQNDVAALARVRRGPAR